MWFTGVAGITGVRVIGTVELKKLQLRFREVGGILTQLFGYLSAQIVTSDFDVLNLTSLTRPEISQGICRFFLIDHCCAFSFQNWTKKSSPLQGRGTNRSPRYHPGSLTLHDVNLDEYTKHSSL